jgi:predicted CxxxxCH...CXXCH cytochrome family protein
VKTLQRLAASTFAILVVSACGSGGRDAAPQASATAAGSPGISFDVTVQRGTRGTVRSLDGRIVCGSLGTSCTARYAWNAQVVLTAYPEPGYMFGTWVGSCSGGGTCILDTSTNGADKWVGATFGPEGLTQHPNFSSPAVHGRAFFDHLASQPGSFNCSATSCHGPTYDGNGIALSCNACHASAGWASWQQSCSFCHGAKTAAVRAGYDFAAHPEWAAPPDDVEMRLSGVSDGAAGAHQKHVNPAVANAVRSPIACSECHVLPATAIHTLNYTLDLPFGPLSRSQGATPTWDAATLTCGTNYCHGSFAFGSVRGTAANLAWTGSLNGCQTCHGMPPTGHAFGGNANPSSCAPCHPDTVRADGTIDLAGGRHINGQRDAAGGACDACHWFPNSATRAATGAHLAHFGLTAAQGSSGYGDLDTLQAKFPNSTPTVAPAAYAFGCGNCHPTDLAQHGMTTGSTVAKVWLYEASAPATSLKARNAPTAAYDPTTGTCSDVYCHSSGQESPAFRATPAWTSGTALTCAGCHDNPPRYPSGGAGAATANSHLVVEEDGYEAGHFLGERGPWHSSQHGAGWVGTPAVWVDSAPITCETCHAETTNPASRGPNGTGFYWLDTTGTYTVPGSWASVNDAAWEASIQCGSCHGQGNAAAPLQAGRVLPLRHVNGSRDVVFDPRTVLPAQPWLPASPATPTRPYWLTQGSTTITGWQPNLVSWAGDTIQFDLATSQYDRTTKTCSNVACHMADLDPRWGTTNYMNGANWGCANCHPGYGGY